MRTRRRTPEEQLEMVQLCRASGLTIAEWCRKEGIVIDTYYTWVERLQKRGIILYTFYRNHLDYTTYSLQRHVIYSTPV